MQRDNSTLPCRCRSIICCTFALLFAFSAHRIDGHNTDTEELFDSTLDEHIGFMDSRPLRAMYAEHVMAPGSQEPFSPPNNPDLVCTPEGEFNFVVGKDGVDTEKWELKPGARPTCAEESMVAGRNNKALEDLLKMPQVRSCACVCVRACVCLRASVGVEGAQVG